MTGEFDYLRRFRHLPEVFDVERFMYDVAEHIPRLSINQISIQADVDNTSLRYSMQGRTFPSLDTVVRLADWAGLSIDNYRKKKP